MSLFKNTLHARSMVGVKRAFRSIRQSLQTPFAIVLTGSLLFPYLIYYLQHSISEQNRKDSIVQAYLESAREFLLHLADNPSDSRIVTEGIAISARAAIMQLASTNGQLNEEANVGRINLIISHLVSSKVLNLVPDYSDRSVESAYPRGTHRPVNMLQGLNLSRINLGALNLAGFNLSRADLRFSNLKRSALTDANLRNASLNFADLGGSRADKSDFRGADMDAVNLSMSRLDRAEFGPDPDAILNDQQSNAPTTKMNRAKIVGSSLVRAKIGRSEIRNANLAGSNLIGADMRGADLRGSSLKNAKVDKTTRFDNALTDGAVLPLIQK
jgi:uncharacterized protein YjbI with pentapeptide repeats